MGTRRALEPRRRPRQARAVATVEAVLEAAAQVFERRGHAGTTTDRIAARAGVSVGSLYQYFPGKDAILLALAERHAERALALFRAALAAAAQEGPRPERLGALLRRVLPAVVALHRESPNLMRLLLSGVAQPPAMQRRLSQLEDGLAQELGALLAALPGGQGRNRALVAWTVLHLVEDLVHDFVLHPPPGAREETFVAELAGLVEGYLLPARRRT